MFKTDTIAAIATPLSHSGIGIIRVSGLDSIKIGNMIFKKSGKKVDLHECHSHTIHYGYIYDDEELIDEVLLSVMKGPHSYTVEDVIEINCHGGIIVMKRILDTVIKYGARPAEPGEFTKRAFLNGRIDLSQAEAVMDIINSKNEYARKSSVNQLKGDVSSKVREMRKKILYHMAYIESALDDPEHISLDGYRSVVEEDVQSITGDLINLIRSADDGRIIKEGIKTVILGKPNAGKSSLMNVLLKEERSIVTEIPGTTRDTLEEQMYLQGISLNIVDTAGIRESEDVVEKIGVDRARKSAEDADLILYVIDGSCPLDENDYEIISFIQGKQAIVILNKMDLELIYTVDQLEMITSHKIISISAKTNIGIDILERNIKEIFYKGELNFNDEVIITNVRHKKALEDTLESMNMIKKSIEEEMPEDFYSIDFMDAYQSLGSIIGEALDDDLVNEIFSNFCMGK